MDKTNNIGLGGFSFVIEETAYQKLKDYLVAIRRLLGNSETTDEVILDIEYRMAELLKERMGNYREIVNTTDIDYLIDVLGKPEQYQDGFSENENKTNTQSQKSYEHRTTSRKKLFRDIENKKLAGVCSGLGYYLGVDRALIRILFIVLPFLDFMFLGISTTSVILIYIILWIAVPPALTTSEKLQMRGEDINVDSIKGFSEKKKHHS